MAKEVHRPQKVRARRLEGHGEQNDAAATALLQDLPQALQAARGGQTKAREKILALAAE